MKKVLIKTECAGQVEVSLKQTHDLLSGERLRSDRPLQYYLIVSKTINWSWNKIKIF